ncbi:uncharacterized protein An16g07050, partial [Aspergillus niger]|uniref:Uncharacterized protein n=2 Tax=Aspergillus niger TaxID=5061 RepID=A0AAJ8E4R4_ASPNG
EKEEQTICKTNPRGKKKEGRGRKGKEKGKGKSRPRRSRSSSSRRGKEASLAQQGKSPQANKRGREWIGDARHPLAAIGLDVRTARIAWWSRTSSIPFLGGLATVRIHGEGPSMRLDEDMNDLS